MEFKLKELDLGMNGLNGEKGGGSTTACLAVFLTILAKKCIHNKVNGDTFLTDLVGTFQDWWRLI